MKKVCFIGAAGHTKQAYQELKRRNDVTLCGFAPFSPDEGREDSFAPEIPFYADPAEMLDRVSPDLAVISPVFALTGKAILLAAERGIDVFSEKPIASSIDELETVQKAVNDGGIRFSAMHYLRFSPDMYLGASLVRSGEIGEVRMITAQKSYRYGKRPVWYSDRSLYGGTIPWIGIHAIDWIYAFTGKQFRSITATTDRGNPEMAALCQFTLDGDIVASMNLDYYRPKAAPTHGDDRVRCVGTQGIVEVRGGSVCLINATGEHVLTPTEAPNLLAEFLDGRDLLSKEEIFYLTRVALLARDAADRGETLQITE